MGIVVYDADGRSPAAPESLAPSPAGACKTSVSWPWSGTSVKIAERLFTGSARFARKTTCIVLQTRKTTCIVLQTDLATNLPNRPITPIEGISSF